MTDPLKELQRLSRGRGAAAKAARKQLLIASTLGEKCSLKGEKSRKKKRDDPEAQHQRAYMQRLAVERPEVWANTFCVPNERKSKGEAGRLRAQGAKSGVPDLLCILPSPSGRWPGMAQEFKAPGRERKRDGGRTPLQVEWGDRFEAARWFYRVVYSQDEAWAAMLEYMEE